MPRDNVHALTIPSPSIKTLGETRVLRYPPPPLPYSKKPKISMHFLEWYTTLTIKLGSEVVY